MAHSRSDQIKRQARQRWRRRFGLLLALAPALSLIAVLFGSSIGYALGQSLGYLPFIDQFALDLRAYRAIISGPVHAPRFWRSLLFSLWVTGAATVLSALGALLVVLALGPRRRLSQRMVGAINFNLAFPHLVWALGLLLLLAQSGLLSRLGAALGLFERPADFPILVRDRAGIGIILAYVTKEVPFLVLLLLSILRSQPEHYGLVAENLGADRWQQLRYVTLPLVWPGLLSGSGLVFAYVFGAYEVPAVLGVLDPQMIAVVSVEFFRNPDLHSRAEGMAISVVMALIVCGLVLLSQRWRRELP